jgi:hypothetical protein
MLGETSRRMRWYTLNALGGNLVLADKPPT